MFNTHIEKAKENVKRTEIFVDVRETILSGIEHNAQWIEEDIEQTIDNLVDDPESLYYNDRLKNLKYKKSVYDFLFKEIDSVVAEILQGGLDNYIKGDCDNE